MTIKKGPSLLPEEENPNSLSFRALKWTITIGRCVIIITELVVICAFVSRFWLDRRNSDLSEVIRQQEAILTSTKSFETEYKSLQQKLETIKNFYSNQPQFSNKITSLIDSTPPDLVYDRLAISKESTSQKITATVSLTALKESSIIDFISNLVLNPDIEMVDLSKIEKKAKENNYSIDLLVVFNSNSNKKI